MIAAVACVLTSLVGLGGWYGLKLWSLNFWRELSFPFMPVLLGVSVGGVARWCTPAGTFGLAGFAAMLIHVNLILSRGMVIYGQGGPDRAIFDSTSLVKDVVFVDQEVSRLAGEPVPDEDIPRFRRDELPYLERLLHDRISRPAFETSLIAGVRSRISWGALAFHGFGPLLALGILWGMIIAYRLARRYSEIEDI